MNRPFSDRDDERMGRLAEVPPEQADDWLDHALGPMEPWQKLAMLAAMPFIAAWDRLSRALRRRR